MLSFHLSGFVTDEDVMQRESKLRESLRSDTEFQVKEGASVEVAQVELDRSTFASEKQTNI